MSPTLALLLLCQAALYSTATSKTVCGRPPVTNGMEESTLKRVYEPAEEVTLTCAPGYVASTANPRRISCTAAGQWTPSDLTCSPRMCPIPKPLQALAMGRTEVPFKTVLNFTCDDGYVMEGANESRCLNDGTWSHPPPLCKAVSCALPKAPRDGRIVHDNRVAGATTIYGQGWTYECNPPKAPSFERGSCMADGNATEPPVCREVSCTIPAMLPNGFITFAIMRVHGYKEKVKYACNDHYVLDGEAEIQCQNTGNWSTMPVCRAPCAVGIKRGRIFYNAKKLWIGDLKPNRVLHGEPVVFYCLNKSEKCGYPVASVCHDGNLPIPECFVEPGKVEYTLRPKSLPSEITTCAAAPATAAPAAPASPANPARPAYPAAPANPAVPAAPAAPARSAYPASPAKPATTA
ncbi:beta-2-glycoprotein 1-like [Diretmus argenteus]